MKAVSKADLENSIDSLFDQAVDQHRQGREDQALGLYERILKEDVQHAPAWSNLGSILRNQGHHQAALVCLKKALELSPGNPSFMTNYGNLLAMLDHKDEALRVHAEAAKARPKDFLIRKNYALCLRDFAHYDEALYHIDIAASLGKKDKGIEWEKALLNLHLGNFEEGWKAYEARFSLDEMRPRNFDFPAWHGESFKGKTLLIYAEQGFGDTILGSRYIPLVKERGGKVILECKSALHRLFSTIPGIDKMIEPGEKFLADYHVAMMSLPGIFKTDMGNIPKPAKLFLGSKVPKGAAEMLKAGRSCFRVGIVWSGSVTFKNNHRRAVSVERFLPLAAIPGVQLYSLQKGPCEKELQEYGAQHIIFDLGSQVDDFADTAAILKNLDLVVMTDSSVAHLAGTVNCPIWNLLNYNSYWLYSSGRDDCPWYPSMRLIRQQEPSEWGPVFKTVERMLERAVEKKRNGLWN